MNLLVDAIALISFLAVAKTGLIIFFFLSGRVKQGRYQEFFGITKGVYSSIHEWAGIVMIVLAVIHVLLHWQWIVCNIKNLFKKDQPNA